MQNPRAVAKASQGKIMSKNQDLDKGAVQSVLPHEPNALEKLLPRCAGSDLEDFPDLKEEERCWNCRVWEAIEAEYSKRTKRLETEYNHRYDIGYAEGRMDASKFKAKQAEQALLDELQKYVVRKVGEAPEDQDFKTARALDDFINAKRGDK